MSTPSAAALDLGDFTSKADVYGSVAIPRLYGEALVRIAERDPRVVCLGGDLTASTETDLFRDRFPDRFFHMGIAEANMVGVAAGMARSGDVPFLHSFSVFATRRCYDQIAMQAAYPRANVKIVGFMPGLTTLLGVSHQAIDDVALMRALPNMTIIEPGPVEDIGAAVDAAMAHDGPVYLRMRRAERAPAHQSGSGSLAHGGARLLRDGRDGVIMASGMMVDVALQASQTLEVEDGLRIAVADIYSLKPLNLELVRELGSRFKIVMTAENHSVVGGLGSAVAEILMDAGIAPAFRRLGVKDTFAEGGSTEFLFEKYGISEDSIVSEIRSIVNGS